ncbi:Pectinesterase [Heracleum sosnowskyi]|uniref:Pectinesterase n=1 Tax=Heracleum sosnowskyi TaxID=360622 RepID=A0AAD8HEY3_9APIA|nr:Pectinesterase [Heracleum sosnowskyi]
MESSSSKIKKLKNLSTRTLHQRNTLLIFIFLTLITTLFASFLPINSSNTSHHPLHIIHPTINNACVNTLYPSFCFTSLSSVSKKNITLHHILEITVNQTLRHVKNTRLVFLIKFVRNQDLSLQQKNAVHDCLEMLDQTLYQLRQATDDLYSFPTSDDHNRSYGNLKTLLSAAMTNENTCLDGFLDLELDSDHEGRRIKDELEVMLSPSLKMISNSLALIKNLENRTRGGNVTKSWDMWSKEKKVLGGMTVREEELMEVAASRLSCPNVTVAKDGSGNFTTIEEAVQMAPNKSLDHFVIKIKAGIYLENVVIPRPKHNVILVGDGMNLTVIMGSRSLMDGFSTFKTATLTVIGDRFLARDITIINTSGPEKHQAVALRVTSNAAFYHCEIISHQDTLYAHSLRQFYLECTIQGTIDFIFGNAAAIFQNCRILIRKPNPGQANMVTAQGRQDPNQNTGISLQNCTIVAARNFSMAERQDFSTFLGRPWRNYSRTVIMKSYIGTLVNREGWCKWNNYSTLDTIDYIEYKNFGPGSNTTQRVTWPGYKNNCSDDIARQFSVEEFLREDDDWLESTAFPFFNAYNQNRNSMLI